MNVLGIIAEYNPFHNGHRYHLEQARQKACADGVVCVMSGNFVQRGEPAFLDKWARAQMALNQGVDLVFELPVLYATRSAYWFAKGGVLSLYRTGIVSHLAFGVETAEPALLKEIAKLLANEPASFQKLLRQELKTGSSFPKARAKALPAELAEEDRLLHSPNNVLALAYLQVLEEEKIPLTPVMIQRQGSGYHDRTLEPNKLPSATALRQALLNGNAKLHELTEYMPVTTQEIIAAEYRAGKGPFSLTLLDAPLLTLLRRASREELRQIVEVTEGLENRIQKTAASAENIAGFLDALKTKRYPYTRLQRFLIHLLLNYTKKEETLLSEGPPYLRLLGFTPKGQGLLKMMKQKAVLPLITKGSQIKKYLPDSRLQQFWEFDVRATNLYSLLYPDAARRQGNFDYLRKPVFCPASAGEKSAGETTKE